jgi:hypothetical protein
LIARALAFAAAAGIAAAPCTAADLDQVQNMGERRSGATGGVYFAVPFGGERSGRSQAGLRLQMTHDYRDAAGQRLRTVSADTFELRLLGERQPTLFVADQRVTGREARHNLFGAAGVLNLVVIGLAVVGGYVIYKAIDDDDDEAVPLN